MPSRQNVICRAFSSMCQIIGKGLYTDTGVYVMCVQVYEVITNTITPVVKLE